MSTEKAEKILSAIREKLLNPSVPNNVTGKIEVNLKDGGIVDNKVQVNV
jgi:hypothetical protein